MEDILRKLVSFRTVTGDAQATHEAMDYIADFVIRRGMYIERYEHNGNESLVATIRPNHKTPAVMLAGHLDVVPGNDDQFELREEGGKLYGRGVYDMLFAIAGFLQIIDDLQERLQEYDFALMITSDEENGGSGIKDLLDEGYRAKVCILPDGGANWQIQTHSRGFFYSKLSTTGIPAHGSRPWLGENAIYPLLDAIREIRALFGDNTAKSSTLNIGKIEGGNAPNQVADYAVAYLDIRVATEKDRHRLLEAIRDICSRHGAQLDILIDGAVCNFSLKDPYIAAFAQIITDVTGITVKGSRTLASNDARHFSDINIPCISLYGVGGGHHGPEEWIEKQSLVHFREITLQYLDKVGKAKAPSRRAVHALHSAVSTAS